MKGSMIFIIWVLIFCITGTANSATFTVDIVADDANAHDSNPGDGICSDDFGSCTLRAAMEEANALAGSDVILFANAFVNETLVLSGSEGPLPVISSQMFILGYSIDAYNSSATLLRDAPPQFTIDGSQLSSGNGFLFSGAAASGSVLSALGIVNFPSDGVVMALGADNISINRSYIGIHPNGTVAGNGAYGINAVITDDHKIGKTRHSNGSQFVSLGNVISANGASGIRLFNSSDNVINANLIGLAPTGTSDRGNGVYGIRLSGNNNQVGDFINSLVAGNFLAGNNSGGILIEGDNNRVYTNQLGLGETGGFISSEGDGIRVVGQLNFIGTLENSAKNKVYEHQGAGIRVGVSGGDSGDNNIINNNTIGSANTSSILRSSNGDGIVVSNGNTNAIANNTVVNSFRDAPGTFGHAITVFGDESSITGNQVGFGHSNNAIFAQPNEVGISVFGNNNDIGSDVSPNTVAGNSGYGIYARGMDNTATFNEKLGNAGFGIQMEHTGGNMIIRNNYIGDNGSDGLRLDTPVGISAVQNNVIGRLPNGVAAGNVGPGIQVLGGDDFDIALNSIANNMNDAIRIVNGSAGVSVYLNVIYNNAGQGIDLGGDGDTANDVDDFDEGDNRLQNFPVIESVVLNENATPRTITIRYHVNSADSINASDYPLVVDFYWNSTDGSAQGRYFIDTDFSYTTPNMAKTVVYEFNSAATGGFLTATAYDLEGNSSEFSPYFEFGETDLIFADNFEGE